MSSETTPERIWLVDGSGIVFRAFHALPTLATRRGLPTGAAYGFTSMLAKLLREEKASHIAVVFDAPGKTFRSEAFADYKATRPGMPSELAPQLPYIRRVVEALGIRLIEIPGVEADDVIGTLTGRAVALGVEVRIVTSDKDMMQLVGPHVTLVDTMHDRTFGVEEVRGRFGVEPSQVVEVMALMGDSIDNIPGVKGIGEKTASRLISHYGSVEEMYRRLDEIETLGLRGAKRVRTILEEGAEDARRSRFLATIRSDLPIELDVAALARGEPDTPELKRLAVELEFTNLLKGFIGEAAPPRVSRRVEQAAPADVERMLAAPGCVAVAITDVASASAQGELRLGPPQRLVAIASAEDERVLVADAIPSGVGDLLARRRSGCTLVVDDLKALLHLLGLDQRMDGAAAEADVCDVPLASYVLDPSRRAHSIEALANDRLNRTLPKAGEGDPSARTAELTSAMLELGPMLLAELDASGLARLYRDVELPLARVLAVMEARGIAVDREALEQAGRDFRATADALEAEIFAAAGGPFNLGSPAQLREVLFGRLNLPTKGVRRGKTGLSVDADVLGKLAEAHPIAAKIVEHRALSKLVSTYVAGLGVLIDPATGRLRTSFNQTVAATGRLSSSEPNLQNIPVRSAEGRRIRAAFVAAPGMLLLSADYSQIELRVLAHLTQDPVLLDAFRKGQDVHRRTAAEVFGVAPDAVTPEMRRQAKVINFGIIYGMGPQRLSRELGITLVEADDYIRRYFERYARVREFADRVVADGRRDGFVATLIGRRRYLPDLNSREPNIRQAAERMAWNSPIQGTAADVIKLAMLAVEREVEATGSGARMLLQVHDELLFEVPQGEVEAAGRLVRRCMESVVELAVPLLVELKTGPNWAALQ
ncbi:MAG: DNA polymerase I [Thermodesulfobacteriota bacterium]